jgi:DNA-binding response OmpR family regulator
MTPHILVIDDRINLSRFIAMELHSEGYRVSLSYDHKTELSIVREMKPDLIVLNWELRRTSGFNIYRQLRAVDKQVPIVVITAKDESSCRLALELEVQTCLTKPFLMNDLLKAIEHLLCEKQMMECSVCK